MKMKNLKGFPDFLKSDGYYKPNEINKVLDIVKPYFTISYSNQKVKYLNVPCAFDIETSSFFRSTGKDEEKVAIMYEWTFGIYGVVIIGRTWDEFTDLINTLSVELGLNSQLRLCVYVHNLSYEFQFIRKLFTWLKVFSIDKRKPIYGVIEQNIEFRCSYLLSGYSLEKLGDELFNYPVRKLVGALDYDKIRHSKTPLTDTELSYCINDVKVVMAYIAERILIDKTLSNIPLTKTGYVRKYCRNMCFYDPGLPRKKQFKRLRYRELMKGLRLTASEYMQAKRGFQGGFTHTNQYYADRVAYNVTSFDFTSSYPFTLISEMFPMGSSEVVVIKNREDFERNLKMYCCLFDVRFTGLKSKVYYEHYLSISRCRNVHKPHVYNGRVISADMLTTTITEQDYMIIKQFYTWDKIEIGTFRRYRKDYLPLDFVKAILKLYQDKTMLKGVPGKEVEYMVSKGMLNACYGMTVTDIVRDEHPYSDHWLERDEIPPVDKEKVIAKYNNNPGRFLFYPWGVWVTAYARRNLFTGILEFKDDYIYSDTDSIKVVNAEKHMSYIEEYNRRARNQLIHAMKYHNLNPELIEPKTKDGVPKCLGLWDFDGHYARFKSLGAKRYMVEYSDDPRNKAHDRGKIQITVAGLNKNVCVPYLCNGWYYDINGTEHNSPFEKFTNNLYVPPEYTGKLTHTYIDTLRTGVVTDYMGNSCEYYERSSVHLEKGDYSLSIAREYSEFFANMDTIDL